MNARPRSCCQRRALPVDHHTCEHQSANHKRQLQDEPGQAGGVHCAASIGKLGQSAHTFPRWSRAGADIQSRPCSGMERRWARGAKPCVGLGACGALDTTEMKTLDDQAAAGSNTEDFLELRRVTEVRAKRAPLLTFANLARRVSALLGEDVPAVTLQGAVRKFMQVNSCFACGKTFSRAREEDSNQK